VGVGSLIDDFGCLAGVLKISSGRIELPEIPLDPTLCALNCSVEFVPTLFQIVQLRELLLRLRKLRPDPFEFVAELLDFRLLFVDGLPLLWEVLNDPF